VERIVSVPDDFTFSPAVQPPPGGHGQDRSAQHEVARELTWARFDRLVTSLARQIKRSYRPDAVVGVVHGGVFVGGAVASVLGAEFFPVRISRRSRDHGYLRTPRLFGEMPAELKGRRVLVVDDVASSGDTLELARLLLSRVRVKETRTASLIARGGAYAPDWVSLTTGELFVFPWDYELFDYGPEQSLDPRRKNDVFVRVRKRR
jgi:hypothetical protein